jgi:hypothetical protein
MCSCIYRSIHGSKPCNEYQQTGTQPGWVILKRPGCVVCWGPKIKQFWLLSAVMGATKKMAREYPVTPWHWLRQWQFNDLNTAIKNRWYLRWSRLRFIFQVYTIHITIYIYIIIIYYFNYQHLIFINIYIYYSNYKVFPKKQQWKNYSVHVHFDDRGTAAPSWRWTSEPRRFELLKSHRGNAGKKSQIYCGLNSFCHVYFCNYICIFWYRFNFGHAKMD